MCTRNLVEQLELKLRLRRLEQRLQDLEDFIEEIACTCAEEEAQEDYEEHLCPSECPDEQEESSHWCPSECSENEHCPCDEAYSHHDVNNNDENNHDLHPNNTHDYYEHEHEYHDEDEHEECSDHEHEQEYHDHGHKKVKAGIMINIFVTKKRGHC